MKLIHKNLNILLIATGVVLIWRGVWGLADLYLVPEMPTLSFILSIIFGLVVLFALNPRKKDISELI